MAFLFGISWSTFFILCFIMVGFVAVMAYGFPGLFQAFLILIISTSLGWVFGRLLAPFLFRDMSPLAIDYFGFFFAGMITLIMREYLKRKIRTSVRY